MDLINDISQTKWEMGKTAPFITHHASSMKTKYFCGIYLNLGISADSRELVILSLISANF